MKRFELGNLTIRINGNEEYSNAEVLKDNGDFKIVKKESAGEIQESRYVYTVNDQEIVFIKGDRKGNTFHITRIENATNDEVSGKFIPLVFSVMEDDLRKQGVTRLTTNALTRLGPILIKRYGFVSEDGKTYEDINSLADRDKKWQAVPLVKYL